MDKRLQFSDRAERIVQLLANQTGLGPNHNLVPATKLADLDMDSLDFVEFILDIERKFQIEIPDVFLNDVETIADLIDYVERQIQ